MSCWDTVIVKKETTIHIFSYCRSFARGKSLDVVYSCFEKGCPTKPYATMPKGIMGNGDLWYLIEALGVSAT